MSKYLQEKEIYRQNLLIFSTSYSDVDVLFCNCKCSLVIQIRIKWFSLQKTENKVFILLPSFLEQFFGCDTGTRDSGRGRSRQDGGTAKNGSADYHSQWPSGGRWDSVWVPNPLWDDVRTDEGLLWLYWWPLAWANTCWQACWDFLQHWHPRRRPGDHPVSTAASFSFFHFYFFYWESILTNLANHPQISLP